MAYNPYDAIKNILNLKSAYTSATDTKAKEKIANDAQTYYKQLSGNGYGDIAGKLGNADVTQAKGIYDNYVNEVKSGKSATRPYLYSSGGKYGLTQADIDKDLTYDNGTGEVSLGGKSIGKPAVNLDGTTYYDPTMLDSAFNDYITRTGKTRKVETMIPQENEKLFKNYDAELGKNNEVFGFAKQNPLDTELGKSIMANFLATYGDKANVAKGNEIAAGGADNSGNIDSFAAANATRQKTAIENQGKMLGTQTAISAQTQQIANMNSSLASSQQLLRDMGINISRVAADDQTAKNNAVDRSVKTSQVTGKVPFSMGNPFFNEDGTLKNETTDYQSIIINAENQLKTETDSKKKADLEYTIKTANEARTAKVQLPAYKQYANTLKMYAPDATAPVTLANKQIDTNVTLANNELASKEKMVFNELASNEKIATANNQADITKANISKSNSNTNTNTSNVEYDNALAAVKALGYVATDEQARILGIPKGQKLAVSKNTNVNDGTNGESSTSKLDDVKSVIYLIPKNASPLYYPLQELSRNRVEYERKASTDEINKLIVEEAAKIARAEGRKLGQWEIGEVMKAQGFKDYKTLEKLYKG